MTKWMPLALSGLALALLIAVAFARQGGTDNAQAISPINQLSIDMQDAGNGAAGAGDRNGDTLPDSEGVQTSPPCADTNDDDGDTTADDGCAAGPPVVGTPEFGLCGNTIDDDKVDIDGSGTQEAGDVFDFTADDGCVTTLSTRETCIAIWDDGILNQDEDTIDRARIDITVGSQPGPGGGIPAGEFMTAFGWTLNWSSEVIDGLGGANAPSPWFLISSAGAASPFSNITNAPAVASPLSHAAADAGTTETGAGVLSRATIEGNAAGLATLTLSGVSVKDTANVDFPITTTADGTSVAVSKDLDASTVIGDSAGELFVCPTSADISVPTVTVTAGGAATVGVAFNVTVDATIGNSAASSVNVDVTATLAPPADCTAAGGNVKLVGNHTATSGSSAIPQQTYSVTCSQPSAHAFSATVSAVIDDPSFIEANAGNNSNPPSGANNSPQNTNVTAESNLSVAGVVVSGPAGQAIAGQPFDVTATVAVGNAGPFGPADADVTSTLTLPGDCITGDSNPQTVQNTSIPLSPPDTDVDVVWSVTCTNSSDHSFSADGTVAVDQLHVSDPNGANNGPVASLATNIEVFKQADVAVTTVDVSAPGTQAINTAFDVTADVDLSNLSGVDPVDVDTTITLALPADCSTTDTNPVTIQNTSVSQAGSPVALAQQSWSVTCTQPSTHNISVGASAAIDMVHVSDSASANNSGADAALTAITAKADVKVVSVTLTVPASVGANVAFDAKVDASLLNNGPFGPANAKATVTLNLPADCTSAPTGAQVAGGISLAVSTAKEMPQQKWSVTCTKSGSHSFSANVVLAIDHVHVSDTDAGNDSASSAVMAVAVGPTGLPPTGGSPLMGSDGEQSWLILIPVGLALAIGMGLLGQRYRNRLARR
jgi:hypothetical protein